MLRCYVLHGQKTLVPRDQHQAAGMSTDNVRGLEIARKINISPRSEGHDQQTYQQARKGFIYFTTLPLITFISQLNRS